MNRTSSYVFFLFVCLSGYRIFSQVEIVCLDSEKKQCYKCFRSLTDASKVPVDSVQGLVLMSNNFRDFPKEVLKFKNLRYLKIDSYLWSEVLDSLTVSEKEEYNRLKAKTPDIYEVIKYYKPDYIISIPKEIKDLKNLEVVDLMGTFITNKKKFKR